MEKIILPNVELERVDAELQITHRRTGMTTKVSAAQLDRWSLRLLRDELSVPSAPVNTEPTAA